MKIVHVIENKMQNEIGWTIEDILADKFKVGVAVYSETSNDGEHEVINIIGDLKYVVDYFESVNKLLKAKVVELIDDGLLDKDWKKR